MDLTPKYSVNKVSMGIEKIGHQQENVSMKKQHVQLSQPDREYLEKLVAKGEKKVKVYKRAIGLLELNRGKMLSAGAETLNVTHITVESWRDH